MRFRGQALLWMSLLAALIAAAVALWAALANEEALWPAVAGLSVAIVVASIDGVGKIRAQRASLRAAALSAVRVGVTAASADIVVDFGVHTSIDPDQPYLERGLESEVRRRLLDGEPVLILGRALAGKSRLAAEVVSTEPQLRARPLVILNHKKALAELASSDIKISNAVVWVNRLETFLGDASLLNVQHLRTLGMNGNAIVATMEDARFDSFRPSGNLSSESWDVLNYFSIVVLAADDAETRNRLAESIRDERMRQGVARYGLGAFLGAGPEAESRLEHARDAHPRAFAIVRAAIDWRRSLIGDSIPVEIARSLVQAYFDEFGLIETNEDDEDEERWAEGWVTNGRIVRLLDRTSDSAAWFPFEYLTQLVQEEPSQNNRIPFATWQAIANSVSPPEALFRAGVVAATSGEYRVALALFRRAAQLPDAAFNLSVLLGRSDSDEDRAEANYWLRKAGEAGHVEGMFRLGLSLKGSGTAVGKAESFKWLILSANAGNGIAMAALATELFNTHQEENLELARLLWIRAADLGVTAALTGLAIQLENSKKEDERLEARKWWILAAEAGEISAMVALVRALSESDSASDRELATFWLRSAAEAGDLDAMAVLATELANSDSQKYRRESLEWWTRAAEAGHVQSMVNLGALLHQRDDEESRIASLRWWKLAGEAGSAQAMTNIGVATQQDDPAQAIFWYRRAAEAGHVHAMASLADMLAAGNRENRAEAEKWWKRAAAAGDVTSMVNLGVILLERDWDEARKWWTNAARAGHLEAMRGLGKELLKSADKRDRDEGRRWWTKAAEAGDHTAIGALSSYLEQSELEADRLEAREWLRKGAEAGHPEFMVNYGALLDKQDRKQAIIWWKRAAEMDQIVALYNLGVALWKSHRGQSVKSLVRAAEGGHPEAQKLLVNLLHSGRLKERVQVLWAIFVARRFGRPRP